MSIKGAFDYASVAPRLFALKSRLIDKTKMQELAQAEDIGDFLKLLRDTRYSDHISNAKTMRDVAKGISRKYFEDAMLVLGFSKGSGREIISHMIRFEEGRTILITSKPLLEGDTSAAMELASSLPPYKSLMQLSQNIEGLVSSQGESRVSVLKRVVELVQDRVLRKWFEKGVKLYESEQKLALVEAALLTGMLSGINNILNKKLGSSNKELESLLCPLLDYEALRTISNLVKVVSNEHLISRVINETRACRIMPPDLSRAASSGSFLPLYTMLSEAYGLGIGRVGSEEGADEKVFIGIRKLVKRRCEHQFASYPFTPALPVAGYLLLRLEYTDLMSLISRLLVSQDTLRSMPQILP